MTGMTAAEAARALGKSAWWVRRQCRAGVLRASYFGGSWLITPEAISEFVDAHSNTPQPATPRRRPRR